MLNENSQTPFKHLVIAIALFLAGSLFGSSFFSTGDRGGDKIIIEQQKQILANQRDFTTKLDGLSKTAAESNRRLELVTREVAEVRIGLGGITNEVQQVTEGLRSNDALLQESRRLDSEDERTLRAILERNKSPNKTP